jgi:glycosyltransferase involved in cell wall biosynthesis
VLAGPPLRLAVLANFDSPHAWRWTRVFIERGHEVHAISYRAPARALPGARLHVLREAPPSPSRSTERGTEGVRLAARNLLPPSLTRLANAMRFRRAGLERLLGEIRPDVLHAHFVVEHGFFAAVTGFHPLVVSAWGSDLFRAPRTPAGAAIARYTLRRADFVTANDGALLGEALRMGAKEDASAIVRLGLERDFLAGRPNSVNLGRQPSPPTVVSDRALEPLYNVDVVIRAFAKVRETLPAARLVVAHDGSQRARLERLAQDLGQQGQIEFVGRVDSARLKELLVLAHVYVSVPSSDSLSLSTMEAMACGAFPIVSDLPSQEWIVDRVNGRRVPVRDEATLAAAVLAALSEHDRRREAAAFNRRKVEEEGDLEKNMLVMERHYYRLAGHPLAHDAI